MYHLACGRNNESTVSFVNPSDPRVEDSESRRGGDTVMRCRCESGCAVEAWALRLTLRALGSQGMRVLLLPIRIEKQKVHTDSRIYNLERLHR